VSEALAWVAEDAAAEHVLEIARKAAETSTGILITGESGTGKDQWAGPAP
jgi:DNA-binding NtrC family response regulator